MPLGELKLVDKDGVQVAILSNGRTLMLKRINPPIIHRFIMHPGKWSFVCGGRKRGEEYVDAAYREIKEETGILKENLKLLVDGKDIMVKSDEKGIRWKNKFFVFASDSPTIRLNFENTDYKWLDLQELSNNNDLWSMIADKDEVIRLIGNSL